MMNAPARGRKMAKDGYSILMEGDYFEKITKDTHIQEYFVGCESLNEAIGCIIDLHPMPEGVSREDLADYLTEEWN